MDFLDGEPLLVPQKRAGQALVRCHPAVIERIRRAAESNGRTVSAEIAVRLARSLVEDAAAAKLDADGIEDPVAVR